MNARHIDHVNLRIPEDGVDDAREFYGDALGFGIEDALYAADDKPFFDVRLSATAVIHLWPTAEFEPPTPTNYDHVAVVVEESVDETATELADAGVEVEKTLDSPLGATGEAGAVYVRDPFGYRVELKARV
ncbi:lactoylglutathione lyase [Halorubrum sp. DM2]|uniref:VOC family protein n=1 Tax=unclassified Halorubrum TaxID=2642239 RepID=UPI0003DD84CE|nr:MULTISPECIES: VOC family protein [unclassified Halorubrum]CDK40692.1 glyoxalase/bleomycin resistance protein/dioxygenase [Halorubrum sp. AJ67]VTT88178.1 lactoylglutathione lyase [Halorubrum sp. DM2]